MTKKINILLLNKTEKTVENINNGQFVLNSNLYDKHSNSEALSSI